MDPDSRWKWQLSLVSAELQAGEGRPAEGLHSLLARMGSAGAQDGQGSSELGPSVLPRLGRLLSAALSGRVDESRLSPQQDRVYAELVERLRAEWRGLSDKPEETPESTLRALWHRAAGVALSADLAQVAPLIDLDGAGTARLRDLVEARLAGQPLGHLSQRQNFLGIELNVGAAALIPRKETELLARRAIAEIRRIAEAQEAVRVIDVCTGAGNLALSYAAYEPRARVWGADLSEEAVALATRNAVNLGLDGQVQFRAGDLLAPFAEAELERSLDVLTCNPPYISSAKVKAMEPEIASFEPPMAFDGGPFGIRILQRLLQEAPRFLRPGGVLAFEVGLGQGPSMLQRVQKMKDYGDAEGLVDEAGDVRAIVARIAT